MPNGLDFPGLGERILERIKGLGLNVRRFAMQNGYDPSYVYRWTSGTTAPTLDAVKKLARDLGVPLAWLLLGEEGGPAPAAPAAAGARPQDSGQLHAKARRVGKVRARGLSGPLPLVADLDGIASYQTLRRARKGIGGKISGGALVLVSPLGRAA